MPNGSTSDITVTSTTGSSAARLRARSRNSFVISVRIRGQRSRSSNVRTRLPPIRVQDRRLRAPAFPARTSRTGAPRRRARERAPACRRSAREASAATMPSIRRSSRPGRSRRATSRYAATGRRRRGRSAVPSSAGCGAPPARSSAIRRSCSTATRSASRSASSRLCVETRIEQPAARRSSSRAPNASSDLGIEARRRFVEQQDGRLVQQRARQRDLLPRAFRQLGGPRRAAAAQLEGLERAIDRRARRSRGRTGPRRSLRFSRTVSRSHSPGASVRNPIRLRSADAGRARELHAVDGDRSAGRRDQPREHAQRGRLAGAVRPEQRDDFRTRHLERHVVDDGAGAEPASQAAWRRSRLGQVGSGSGGAGRRSGWAGTRAG